MGIDDDIEALETEYIDNVMVIRCAGELGMQESVVLSNRLQEIFETAANRIVFNLKGTNYIDSVGIGILLTKWKKSRKRSGNVKLCCVSDFVLKIMTSLGLTDVLEVYKTEEEALSSFND